MLCTKLIRSIVSESTNDHILSHVVISCSNVGGTVVIECGSDHFHLITFHAKVNGRVTLVVLAAFLAAPQLEEGAVAYVWRHPGILQPCELTTSYVRIPSALFLLLSTTVLVDPNLPHTLPSLW